MPVSARKAPDQRGHVGEITLPEASRLSLVYGLCLKENVGGIDREVSKFTDQVRSDIWAAILREFHFPRAGEEQEAGRHGSIAYETLEEALDALIDSIARHGQGDPRVAAFLIKLGMEFGPDAAEAILGLDLDVDGVLLERVFEGWGERDAIAALEWLNQRRPDREIIAGRIRENLEAHILFDSPDEFERLALELDWQAMSRYVNPATANKLVDQLSAIHGGLANAASWIGLHSSSSPSAEIKMEFAKRIFEEGKLEEVETYADQLGTSPRDLLWLSASGGDIEAWAAISEAGGMVLTEVQLQILAANMGSLAAGSLQIDLEEDSTLLENPDFANSYRSWKLAQDIPAIEAILQDSATAGENVDLVDDAMEKLAMDNPSEAIRMLGLNSLEVLSEPAVDRILDAASDENPGDVVSYFQGDALSSDRGEILSRAVNRWFEQDSWAASRFISGTMPSGPARQVAARAIANNLADQDPEAAKFWTDFSAQ